jgi:hypothetical protein
VLTGSETTAAAAFAQLTWAGVLASAEATTFPSMPTMLTV